jgi:hypothetical protein
LKFKKIPLKLPKKPEVKVHIPLQPPKKPKIKGGIRLQLPKKPELEVPTPPQSQNEPEFRVTLPLFNLLAINNWFLATWTFPQGLQYLRNLNISRLRDAPLLIVLKLHAEARIREYTKTAREKFTKMMFVAKSQSQTTAAAAKFIKQIDSWILEVRSENLRQNPFLLETHIQKSN